MLLLAAALAWLAVAAVHTAGWAAWWSCGVLAAAALLPASNRRTRVLHTAVAGLVVAGGSLTLARSNPPSTADEFVHHVGMHIQVRGQVTGDIDRHPAYLTVTYDAGAIQLAGAWRATAGKLRVLLGATSEIATGDTVELDGQLTPGGRSGAGGGFDRWLALNGVDGIVAFPRATFIAHGRSHGPLAGVRRLRDSIVAGLNALLPAREAAFADGLLFGTRHDLPRDLAAALQNTGTMHFVALSAFDVVLVYGVAATLFAPLFGKRPAVLIALAMTTIYSALGGPSAGALRSDALLTFLTLAAITGRPYSSAALLVLAAAALTATRPNLVADTGFQFTFAAAGGLTLLLPPLRTAVDRAVLRRLGTPLPGLVSLYVEQLLLGTAIALAILPVAVAGFGSFQPLAPLFNALLAPIIPLTLPLAALAGWLARVWRPLADLAAAPLWLILRGQEQLLLLGSTIPGASLSTPAAGMAFVAAWWGSLSALLLTPRLLARRIGGTPAAALPDRRLPRRALSKRALAATFAPVLVLGVLSAGHAAIALASSPPHTTRVSWLDADGAAAIVVEGQNGTRVLISTGNAPQATAFALQQSAIGLQPIDAVVLSAPLRPGTAASAAKQIRNAVAAAAILIPAPEGIPPAAQDSSGTVIAVQRGESIPLGGNDRLEIEIAGSGQVVTFLEANDQTLVLTGTPNALSAWRLRHPDQRVAAVALQPAPAAQVEAALHNLAPSLILLRGRWSDAARTAVRAASGARLVETEQLYALQIAIERRGLTVSYRDR